MKKLLFVLLAVLLTSVSFAQFKTPVRSLDLNVAKNATEIPNWAQIGQPFVATDVYGNTVDLAAILASGHGVVIDYSGYWCGPCWNVHTSGILEAIDEIENVDVIWVETTSGTTMDQLDGTDTQNSWGDWLHTDGGAPVPYPVIIDANNNGACLNTCMSFYANAVPMILFIAPNGWACDIYGMSYGINTFDGAACAANIRNLMVNYPQAGQAPIVNIAGPARARVGANASFTAEVVSVDPVTSYTWDFQGGSPATATGATASTSWNAAGNYTVTLTVANANGSTTATINVEAYNQDPNVLSYVGHDTDVETFLGTNGEVYWATAFPASLIPANKYLSSVDLYVGSSYSGNYELIVYQGGSMTSPGSVVYRKSRSLTGSDSYQTFPVNSAVAVDNSKPIWIAFHTTNISYPMACLPFSGDEGSDLLSTNGSSWSTARANGFNNSWAIEARLADTPNTGINGVENVTINMYPNPTTGILNINAEGVKEVAVVDIEGKVVMTENANVIDMTNLNNGVYFVRVISNEGMSIQKVVKK